MKLPLLTPSVTTAVRNLETALADLDRAEAAHMDRAKQHVKKSLELQARARDEDLKTAEEYRQADRANRIRTKLADLLA